MSLSSVGLDMNFVGSVMIGLGSYFGIAAGFGGPLVWSSTFWKVVFFVGWFLMASGFLFQRLAAA